MWKHARWRHQIGTFSALMGAGNLPVTGYPPHKGRWRGAWVFSLMSAWTNSWQNGPDAGDAGTCLFLHEQTWKLWWIQLISSELDITFHVPASQSIRGVIALWRHAARGCDIISRTSCVGLLYLVRNRMMYMYVLSCRIYHYVLVYYIV